VDYQEYLSLLTRCAIHLSRRDCTIRLREPVIAGTHGTCMSTERGMIIDLSPELESGVFYKTFLHEVGHAKTQPFSKSDVWINLPPKSLVTKDWHINRLVQDAEQQAEELAAVWDEFARRNAAYYGGKFAPEFEKRLTALLDYGSFDIDEHIKKAAEAGARDAIKSLGGPRLGGPR
jgi:hypothetical protein